MGWKVQTEVVGPSMRLICEPVYKDLAYPEIFYSNFDDDFSKLDERLQEESSEIAIGPCNAEISINDIEIDFVLAIPIRDWPEQASQWPTRKRNWPNEEMIKKCAQAGHHIVAKPSSESTDEFEWKLSFSQAEGNLLRSVEKYSYCKQCYRIFKCLMKYHLSHPNVISTYHCKTIFLWSIEMHPPNTWTETNLGERFLGLLDSLLHALVHKTLPQYFVISDNLFANINSDFAVTVAQTVSNMRKKPFDFIYRTNVCPWDEEFQGMTIEEMLNWDDNHKESAAPVSDSTAE